MKKTLIVILALGGMAMADLETKDITFSTNTQAQGVSDSRANGVGVAFTLSESTRTNISSEFEAADSSFALTSIQVKVRNDSQGWGNGTCMYITDSSNKLIAVSEGVTSDSAANEYVTFLFGETATLLQENKNRTNAALTLGNTYYAYFLNTAGVTGRNKNVGVKGIGDTLDWVDGEARGIACVGNFGTEHPEYLTFAASLNGNKQAGLNAQVLGYAPVININGSVQINVPEPPPGPVVPEPATGSLSLLALAGLCARRRRK